MKELSALLRQPIKGPAPTLRMLLMQKHELVYERAFAAASSYGYGFVTPAMARLFIQISSEPMSISELARRLAISRQSVHETVSAAARLGLVELVDDARNRRVRIVRFTSAGKQMSRTVLAVDLQVERAIAARIGAKNVRTLKQILSMMW